MTTRLSVATTDGPALPSEPLAAAAVRTGTARGIAAALALVLLCLSLMPLKPAHATHAQTPIAPTSASNTVGQHVPVFSADDQYFTFSVDEAALSGAPDQSHLNLPLTAADRVFVAGPHFYKVGPDLRAYTADDERVRFFGINLSFASNFPPPEVAEQMAKQLRKLGFNAVRLHHLDTAPDDDQTDPRSVLSTGPFPSFNDEAVRRLKYFIEALAREGIYINLNLRVGYQFRPEIDGIPPFDAANQSRPIGSPIIVYHPRMVELQQQYARQLIQRLGLKGSPSLAMVEINNESSLLAAWDRREWTDAIPANYLPILHDLWQRWLVQRYGSIKRACAVWHTCIETDTEAPLLTLMDADLPSTADTAWIRQLQSQLKRFVVNVFGPEEFDSLTAYTGREQRTHDFLLFLAETDENYFRRLRQTVKGSTDGLVAVTGTQMNYGGVLNFTSHADMDYLDSHFYIDHPTFAQGHGQPRNWRMWDESLTGKRMNLLLSEAFRRDYRKPFVISEFNQPYPNVYAAQILPIMAAVALLQDWDGLFFYEYRVPSEWPKAPNNFALVGDWGKYAITGQSAEMFRSGAILPLTDELQVPLPTTAQIRVAAQDNRNALQNHLKDEFGVLPEHAWHRRVSIKPEREGEPAAPPVPNTPYSTPGGSVRYNPLHQLLWLTTHNGLGVFGRIPDNRPWGDDLVVRYTGRGPHHVGTFLSSLDAQAVAASEHLLLTLGSSTTSSQPGSHPERPKRRIPHPQDSGAWTLEPDPTHLDQPSASRYAQGSAWLKRQEMEVTWQAQVAGLPAVYPLDQAGQRRAPLPPERVRRDGDTITLHLQATPEETSPWYEITFTDDINAMSVEVSSGSSDAGADVFDSIRPLSTRHLTTQRLATAHQTTRHLALEQLTTGHATVGHLSAGHMAGNRHSALQQAPAHPSQTRHLVNAADLQRAGRKEPD